MDMALCKFKRKSETEYLLSFSGAKRPLYVIKNQENKLIVHKGDRKSIGGYNLSRKTTNFTNYDVTVAAGDMVYLFSDGIIDQNNPERKKFGRLMLEEALLECAKLPPLEQHALIKQRLADFMQKEEQRDDITLVGLKVIANDKK